MPRLVLRGSLVAILVATACSKPASQQPAPPAALAPGVVWSVVVLYNQPKDTAAFERYYAGTHVPLFASHAQEIGVTRAELIKFAPGADGKAPSVYRMADLRWDSQAAMERGMATAGFKAVAGDIPRFGTGGFTVLGGKKTN